MIEQTERGGGQSGALTFLRALPTETPPLWQQQAVAIACACGAYALRLALEPLMVSPPLSMAFFPAVLIAALWAGPGAGTSALVLSSVLAFWGMPLTGATISTLVAFVLLGSLVALMAVGMRSLLREAGELKRKSEVTAHELEHRIRNIYGLVQSIYRQTIQGDRSQAEQQQVFEGRLRALAQAQDLLTQAPGASLGLQDLLVRVLDPFGCLDRVTLAGPTAALPAEFGTTLGLVLHELTTNAIKYGCLSVPEGRLSISWLLHDDQAALVWNERGGPPVKAPSRHGFGSRLMRQAFPNGQGSATVDYHEAGVRCTMALPVLRKRQDEIKEAGLWRWARKAVPRF